MCQEDEEQLVSSPHGFAGVSSEVLSCWLLTNASVHLCKAVTSSHDQRLRSCVERTNRNRKVSLTLGSMKAFSALKVRRRYVLSLCGGKIECSEKLICQEMNDKLY